MIAGKKKIYLNICTSQPHQKSYQRPRHRQTGEAVLLDFNGPRNRTIDITSPSSVMTLYKRSNILMAFPCTLCGNAEKWRFLQQFSAVYGTVPASKIEVLMRLRHRERDLVI